MIYDERPHRIHLPIVARVGRQLPDRPGTLGRSHVTQLQLILNLDSRAAIRRAVTASQVSFLKKSGRRSDGEALRTIGMSEQCELAGIILTIDGGSQWARLFCPNQ
jgi:hypothetical protein